MAVSNWLKKFLKSQQFIYLTWVLILGLGFGVRLYKIGNPVADWHSWRQADTASVARIYLDEGIDFLRPRYYDISSIQTGIYNPKGLRMVEFPLYNVFHALLAQNFPALDFTTWGRLVSILASIFSAFFLFLIGKRFINKWGGLLAAFFFLFIPYNIYFSRVILPEPLAVALGLASIWLFILYIDQDKKLPLFASGILFALSTLIKPFTFFYSLPLFYLAVQKYGLKQILKKRELLIFADLAIIPFFVWRIWINRYPVGIPHFSWTFNGDHIRFKPAFWYWIFSERLGHLILGGWGLIPFSLGILKFAKKNLFSHFFFLGMLFYVTIFATASVRHDYYQIFLIPAVALLLAQGSIYLWDFGEDALHRNFSRGFLAFATFIMLISGWLQVKGFYQINHPEIIAAGDALDQIAPKDALVIAPYNGDTAFLYQTKRFGWPVVEESFDQVIAKGADYFVTVNFADPDTKYVKERFKVLVETSQYLIVDLHQENPKPR
jgi:hypothetical protein